MKSVNKLVIGAAFVIIPLLALPFLVVSMTGAWNALLVHAAMRNGIYLSDIGTDGLTARDYQAAKEKGPEQELQSRDNARSLIQQPPDNELVRGTSRLKLRDTGRGSQAHAQWVAADDRSAIGLK